MSNFNGKQFALLKLAALASYRHNNVDPQLVNRLFNHSLVKLAQNQPVYDSALDTPPRAVLDEVPNVLGAGAKNVGRAAKWLFANPAMAITEFDRKAPGDPFGGIDDLKLQEMLEKQVAGKPAMKDLARRRVATARGVDIPLTPAELETRRIAAELYKRQGRNPDSPIRNLTPKRTSAPAAATPAAPSSAPETLAVGKPLLDKARDKVREAKPSSGLGYGALAVAGGIPLAAWYLHSRRKRKQREEAERQRRSSIAASSIPSNLKNYYFN